MPVCNRSAWLRKNRTGDDCLDLARSFPGRAGGAVTEQTALAAAELIRRADYLIDLHTGGAKLRLWPLAGYLLHPRRDILETQRLMARAFNLPVIWGTDPSLNGRSLSAARDAEIPAIYVEYLGASAFNRQAVREMAEGCLRVMSRLAMIDRPVWENRVEFFLEDGRPGAGHLQICHPAPHAGCFTPVVDLGQRIELGETLGWLANDDPAVRTRIVAQQSGRIVCLRLGPPVESGEGLVVIANFQRVNDL
jgi:predicted deacylase